MTVSAVQMGGIILLDPVAVAGLAELRREGTAEARAVGRCRRLDISNHQQFLSNVSAELNPDNAAWSLRGLQPIQIPRQEVTFPSAQNSMAGSSEYNHGPPRLKDNTKILPISHVAAF